MADDPTPDERELAERLYAEWDEGRGTSKSQIEIREWDDATAHGRRFDRFIRRTLGVSTSRRSRQTDRISELEQQLRRIGASPVGSTPEPWEEQLQHARNAAVAALRVWNDPVNAFRTGAFSLLFVTAWNSLAIAVLQQRDEPWFERDESGNAIEVDGFVRACETLELVAEAFPGPEHRGLRLNVEDWVSLRNCVAHRHLPALDAVVIPRAQAGLLNFENAIAAVFGDDYVLSDHLSVPLQLSGFRDPGVLASLKKLQASLPLDVQAVLAQAANADPEILNDQTYMLRVAFIPAVPASGRSPDAVAYFVKPGEVPEELADALQQYVVVPKPARPPRPNLGAKQVVREVQERIPWRFTTNMHATLTRTLNVRPASNAADLTATDARYCEYVPAAKLHLYNQAWVDRLVEELQTDDGFRAALAIEPVAKQEAAG